MHGSAGSPHRHRPRRLAWSAALLAIALMGTGCGSSTTGADIEGLGPPKPAYRHLHAKLDGQGSSFQDTFEQQVASDFVALVDAAGGSVAVTYTKTGSSDGKKALADETVSFAGSDAPIKAAERAAFRGRRILYFPIMGGPIAVTYHLTGIEGLNLSAEVVAAIFQGDIGSWDDPAIATENPQIDLPSEPITVVHRSDGSGTTSNFTAFLAMAAPGWRLGAGETVDWPSGSTFQGAEKGTGVTGVVKRTNGAITYADLADVAKEDLSVARIGAPDGSFVAPTPDAASAALAGAEVAADLTYDPLNATAADAYPITAPTWILVDAGQRDRAVARALQAYLRYVLTDGQRRAKSLLYAPLPSALAARALAQVDQIGSR